MPLLNNLYCNSCSGREWMPLLHNLYCNGCEELEWMPLLICIVLVVQGGSGPEDLSISVQSFQLKQYHEITQTNAYIYLYCTYSQSKWKSVQNNFCWINYYYLSYIIFETSFYFKMVTKQIYCNHLI